MKAKKVTLVPLKKKKGIANEDDDDLVDLIETNDYEFEDDLADISDEDVSGIRTSDKSHEKLLQRVKETASLKKKRKDKLPKVRNESIFLKNGPSTLAPLISSSTSESGKKSSLSLRDLASTILKTTADTSRPAVKELTKLAKKKSLAAPLRKPEADQASRVANYEDVKTWAGKKWSDIVHRHKTADHISFPLPVIQTLAEEDAAVFVNSSADNKDKQVMTNKRKKNEMEEKIESLLMSSENRLDDHKELTAAEEKLLQSLSVEEARDRIRELQRTRALLSYQEAKMKRQAKIKSKTYHRIKKRAELKDALKNFETLKQTDPKAALQQLQEMDKSRALERASLRHRNTGKFAKSAKIRAKYDDEARNALEEQMSIFQKNLKRREFSDDEDGDAGGEENGQDEDGLGDEAGDGQEKKLADANDEDPDEIFDVADDYNPWLKPMAAVTTKDAPEQEKNEITYKEVKQIKLRKSFSSNPNDDIIHADDEPDAGEQDGDRLSLRQRSNMDMISEAFADDDVIEEFAKEREEDANGQQQENENNNNLPGWGSWTGELGIELQCSQ